MKPTAQNIKLYGELKDLKKQNHLLKSKLNLQEHNYKILEQNNEKKIKETVDKNSKSIYK